MGSGIMTRSDGKTWKEHSKSKHLDRPRTEGSHSNQKSTCVSKGVDGGSSGSETRMQFSSKQPFEMYGKQTREPKRQEKTETKGNK